MLITHSEVVMPSISHYKYYLFAIDTVTFCFIIKYVLSIYFILHLNLAIAMFSSV